MKKTSILLLAFLCGYTSFVYANENASTQNDKAVETKTSSKKNNQGMYLKVGINGPKIAYNFTNSVKDSEKFNTLSFDFSLGFNVTDKFSTDITVKTFKDIIDKNKTSLTTTKKTLSNTLLLADAYFYITDIDNEFKPYLSIGSGIAAISSRTAISVGSLPETTTKNSNISFAYSAGIGFNTPIWENVFFDMNFKHYNLGKLRAEDISITANSMSMGVKITI